MAIFLDRIDAVPIDNLDVPTEFKQWVTNLTDSLNHILEVIGNNINNGGGDLNWSVVSTSMVGTVNSGYVVNGVGRPVITLPATCAVGDIIRVVGFSALGWEVLANSGQNIAIIDIQGTSVASDDRFDCIELICVVANTSWVAGSLMTKGVTIL